MLFGLDLSIYLTLKALRLDIDPSIFDLISLKIFGLNLQMNLTFRAFETINNLERNALEFLFVLI